VLPVLAVAIVTPARVAVAPVIDGRLDDAAWAGAAAVTALVEKQPHDGHAPPDRTAVWIAYDDANVYVAIDCPQTAPLVARLTRRDREIETDRVEVDLDTRRDGKSAFWFGVSAAGVLSDGLRFDDTELSTEWDGVWDARVDRHGAAGPRSCASRCRCCGRPTTTPRPGACRCAATSSRAVRSTSSRTSRATSRARCRATRRSGRSRGA